ncbi:hypothetical protein BGZ94_009253 [Podila epigama]|nr:hypothetical protein BGZ94_009253 [Podila epigama]
MRFFTPTSKRQLSTPHKATWSLVYTALVGSWLIALASAALDAGFCGDCQTYANAIQPCGGSFTPENLKAVGEYVLPEPLSKCICSAVIQKVLWTCARCAFLGGSKFAAVPPNKYQTQCMKWGTTVEQWNAPYTGPVAPGTQTDLGGGGVNPPAPPPTTTTNNPSPAPKPSGGGNGDNGDKGDKDKGDKGTNTDGNPEPTNSSDNATKGEGKTDESSSPNTKAIGISVGIIGVAAIAGVVAVVTMKRRRRRRPLDLDLDASPALANFANLESHGREKTSGLRPSSPPMVAAPIASATPVVSRGHRNYMEGTGAAGGGSVVGGYDGQYDQYGHAGHVQGYDAYGHDQYQGQYDHYNDQGYYDQGYYDQHHAQGYGAHDYGYDHPVPSSQAPAHQPSHHGGPKANDGGPYM